MPQVNKLDGVGPKDCQRLLKIAEGRRRSEMNAKLAKVVLRSLKIAKDHTDHQRSLKIA